MGCARLLNPHLHVLLLDGTFYEQGGELVWRELGRSSTPEVGEVLARTKDWAVMKMYNLPESFCIAVRGHKGWSDDPDAVRVTS